MRKLIRGAVVSVVIIAGLAGCLSAGRGHGPLESFVFLAGANKALSQNVTGAIDERPQPQEVHMVVAPGTDVRGLVATLSLNKEAAISVISSGTRVPQQNGVTPNDFSLPVTYSIEVPGEKQPWDYKVFVREADTNARLGTLVLPRGSRLQPAFNAAVHAYTLEVPFAAASVRIEARGQSPYLKSVSIDGAESPGAAGGAAVDFQSMQERTVTIQTLAEDGVTRDRYTVRISRAAPDSNSLLESLDVQNVPLFPDFSPEQQGYQALAPFASKQLVVHARPQSNVAAVTLESVPTGGGQGGAAQLQYQGDPVSGSGALVAFPRSGRLALAVTVMAEDGSARQYLVDIRRAPPDRNADLASLSVSAGALSPGFSPRAVSYSVGLPASAANVVVTAVAASPVAQVGVAELPDMKPAPRQDLTISVAPGTTVTVSFVVTAEDGSQRLYRVQIQREAAPVVLDGNALLAMVQLTGAQLEPAFDPAINQYDARVPANVESVALAARPQSQLAAVSIDGAPAERLGRRIPLQPGATRAVVIDVTAQNGATLRYIVRLTRENPGAVNPPAVNPPPRDGQAGGTVTPPPAGAGRDHVVVTAKNLKVQAREAMALTVNGDQVGRLAAITVRYYRTNEIITQYTAPVEVKRQGQTLALTLSGRSDAVALTKDRLVEVETVIRTVGGHFLSYMEAQDADDEVKVDIPFLLYGDTPRLSWPSIGSPVMVAGYLSRETQKRERAEDREDFDKNAGGEYAISVQIVDERTHAVYGTDIVARRPGHEQGKAYTFGKAIQVPEGATVRYILSAKAKNGRVWTASGVTQVWTTMMSYPAGFQPVLLFVSDDLQPDDGKGGR